MGKPVRPERRKVEPWTQGQAGGSAAQSAVATGKRVRNLRVEALRLAAIVGISVFHVFTPWFFWATHPSIAPGAVGLNPAPGSICPLAAVGWPLWILGLVGLLGAWGNHIFYMISAFYLVPDMAAQVGAAGYWRRQWRACLHRCAVVLAAVVFYAVLVLLFSRLARPVPGAGSLDWIGQGLEFIWLYMLFILLAPSWAWLVRRYGGRRWAQALLAFFAFLVYAVNFYVAFLSQGDVNQRGLLDWRKQMSAVTYLLSFMLSGALSCRVRRSAARGGASRLASPRFWGRALSVILLAALAITGALVWGRLPEALYDLSFKSTSLLAFALAFAALFWCALSGSVSSPSGRDRGQVRARARGFAPLAVSALASGILGFYIVQSLMYGLWDPFCARLLSRAIRTGSVALFLVLGLVFGLGFVLVATLFDRLVRKPLLAKLGL